MRKEGLKLYIRILEAARKEAFALVESDPTIEKYPLLKNSLYSKWQERLELIKS
jgi:hypothetical protein